MAAASTGRSLVGSGSDASSAGSTRCTPGLFTRDNTRSRTGITSGAFARMFLRASSMTYASARHWWPDRSRIFTSSRIAPSDFAAENGMFASRKVRINRRQRVLVPAPTDLFALGRTGGNARTDRDTTSAQSKPLPPKIHA